MIITLEAIKIIALLCTTPQIDKQLKCQKYYLKCLESQNTFVLRDAFRACLTKRDLK